MKLSAVILASCLTSSVLAESYWIVPEFNPFDPYVWWELKPGYWINASSDPTLVEIGGGQVMVVASDGIIHHDPDSCRAQCGLNKCALCWWSSGICYVQCQPYTLFNPDHWTNCPRSCSIDPALIRPCNSNPANLDDDKD